MVELVVAQLKAEECTYSVGAENEFDRCFGRHDGLENDEIIFKGSALKNLLYGL